MRQIKILVDEVAEEGGEMIGDVHEFRMKLKEKRGFWGKVPSLFIIFTKLFKSHRKRK